jgi:hypothetical protein
VQGRGPPAIVGEGGLRDPLDDWACEDDVSPDRRGIVRQLVAVMALGDDLVEGVMMSRALRL